MSCAKIQEVLFDYMTHELGDKQSLLVREHLLHCEACRKEAAAIQKTLDILRNDTSIIPPEHLSNSVRDRLRRALLHPVLDWIYEHRRPVAITMAIAIMITVAFLAGYYSGTEDAETTIYWTTWESY